MSSERSSETMSHSHSLSESFAIIDKVYCFCHKNRLDFTVTMLRRILESLGGVNVEQTVLGLRVLWEMCPSLLNISVHDAQSAELVGGAVDYSIQFLRLRGVGKKSKDAREKIVHTILQSFCCGGGAVPAPRPWPEPCPEQADRSKHLGDPCSDLVPTVLTFGDNHEHRIPQENIYGCQYLDCCPDVKNRICFIHKFEKRSASYAELDETLMFPLCCAVRDCFKISKFYKHQAIAINGARERNNVALFSDTSSGKSASYIVPILDDILKSRRELNPSSALLLFPTKALARDQLLKLREVVSFINLRSQNGCVDAAFNKVCPCGNDIDSLFIFDDILHGVVDGDCQFSEREFLCKNSGIILSNPDMLNCSLLPKHEKWRQLFSSLRFVVLDECHMYSGSFGAHVSCVLKRLQRICDHYGSSPTFFFASATCCPAEHIYQLLPSSGVDKTLFGRTIFVSPEVDGAPKGERILAVWSSSVRVSQCDNETDIRSAPSSRKRCHSKDMETKDEYMPNSSSDVAAAVLFFISMVQTGKKTLFFCKSRKCVEIAYSLALQKLRGVAPSLTKKIDCYRAGYTDTIRRKIEGEFRSGSIIGLISTNALELGIDIGDIEVTIHLGFPGTIASLWQQIGRCGRNLEMSMSILFCSGAVTDQYISRHPHFLTDVHIKSSCINRCDTGIVGLHIKCAAWELPLCNDAASLRLWGKQYIDIVSSLVGKGELVPYSNGLLMRASKIINFVDLNIRSIDAVSVVLCDMTQDGSVFDEVSYSRLFIDVFEGAFYLHRGACYLVEHINFDQMRALCKRTLMPTTYITKLSSRLSLRISKVLRNESLENTGRGENAAAFYGTISVEKSAWQVSKVLLSTREPYDITNISLPPMVRECSAFWIHKAGINCDSNSAIHGLHHALLTAAVQLNFCCVDDLVCCHGAEEIGGVLLYCTSDSSSIEHIFENRRQLFKKALDILKACSCCSNNGCPSCIFSFKCLSQYPDVCKLGAIKLLESLVTTNT